MAPSGVRLQSGMAEAKTIERKADVQSRLVARSVADVPGRAESVDRHFIDDVAEKEMRERKHDRALAGQVVLPCTFEDPVSLGNKLFVARIDDALFEARRAHELAEVELPDRTLQPKA